MNSDSYKILAVDDNPKNLKVLAALLASNNFSVDYAFSGAEALKFSAEEEYDLILLDIMMPEMDGFETCRKIKEVERNKDLPVIFLTAKTEIESITTAFNVGGFDYVTKPFRSDELLARVKTHVELKRLRAQQKELNQWLEEQVAQRTAELKTANTGLEKANHELQVLDVAKNEFLRMINHEIRTPLNAILGFTDILKNELKSTSIVELVQYLDQASLRLEKFLVVVLQITELKARNKPLLMEHIPLYDLISATMASLKEQLMEKNILVSTEGDVFNMSIRGNKKLLQTCLTSILENAIHFSEPGSSVCIQAYKSNQQITIEFIDTGSGFSPLALNNLFRVFAIGEKHVDQNSGLGLALVKLIIDAHQGEIEIHNNLSHGATVRLHFKD